MPQQDTQKMMHELEVHQIELEMQNEALREAQATLMTSQERYADLYDFAPVGYFTFDSSGLITGVNLTGASLLRVERGELTNKPFSLFVAAPSRGSFHRHYRGVLKTGTPRTREVQLSRKDGTSFYASMQSVPVRDAEGNLIGVRSTIGDLTERKQAEEGLQRYQLLARHSRDIILFIRRGDARILEANAAATSAYGYSHEELLARSIHDLRAPETDRLTADQMAEAERHGILFETFHRRKDGSTFPVEVSSQGATIDSAPTIISVVRDITARKQAEQALRDSEARYQRLVELSPDAILVHAEGKYVYANPAGVCLFGARSSEEVIGRDVLESIHPDHRQLMVHRIEEACAGAVTPLGEIRFIRLDGSTVDTEVTCRQVEFGGRPAIQTVVRDITERKRAEEALQQSHERFRALAEATFEGIAFTEAGRILEVNDQLARMLGYGKDELIGTEVSSVIFPEDRRRVLENIQKGRESIIEHRFIRKDGVVIAVEAHGKPFTYEGRGIRVTALRDITERKRVEEALQKAHDELELRVQERTSELQRQAELLNLTHDAIIACDLNHRVLFWNRGAEERYGWTNDEVKGKATDDLLQTVYPRPRQEIEQELLLRGWWEGELTDTTRDGRKVIVASRQALRRDEDGKPIAILEINSDITEQKRIEEQLRQSQKMEAVGTLAGGIAHDFNNILAALIGFTEMALDDVDQGSRLERNLQRVLKSGIRARELVKQILAFSRTTAKERKPLELSSVVEEAIKLLRASLPSSVDLRFIVESESGTVLADPTQIQQIVMNLCTNAVHAMEDRGLLKLTLSDFSFESPREAPAPDMQPGAYLRLSVSDTGHGMSKEVMGHLFDPFFTTKGPGQGTGLGLSVVHGIVKSHGGAITVESEPGKGSTLTVYLPRLERKTASETDKETSAPTGNERILFVDDEGLIVEMAEGMLKGLGYRVVSKTDGREALDLFKANPEGFDLIITDQTMPHMTGVELAQEMIGMRGDIPIILATGFSHRVDADSARAAGIRAFVMKPLTRSEIAHTIREVLV